MQRRVSDAMEAFKCDVGSRMCMSEVQFELHCCKNRMHLQGAELRTKFKSLDKDKNNNIDFSEYLRWRLKDSPFESDKHYNQEAIDIAASCFQPYETEPPASRPLPEGSEPVVDPKNEVDIAASPPVDSDQTPYAGCLQLPPAAPDYRIEFLENMFSRFDIDGDGYITK